VLGRKVHQIAFKFTAIAFEYHFLAYCHHVQNNNTNVTNKTTNMNTATVPAPATSTANLVPVASRVSELQTIQAQKAELAQREQELQNAIEQGRAAELRELAGRFGFTDSSEFLTTYARVNNIRVRGLKNHTGGAQSASIGRRRPSQGRKARVTITDELRSQIKADFKAEKSKEDICEKYNISPAAAQIIKNGQEPDTQGKEVIRLKSNQPKPTVRGEIPHCGLRVFI
jgi:hypothetical protein